MCEYGYGPVAPCRIYLGKELIGLVTYDDKDHTRYRFDSMKDVYKRQTQSGSLAQQVEALKDHGHGLALF